MNRRDLLRLGALTPFLSLPRLARANSDGRRLLTIFVRGGWDPSFVFDSHFDSPWVDSPPDTTVSNVSGIEFADSGSRPSVREFFERYGAQACVVNGIAVGSISHVKCEQLLLTGSRESNAADLCSLVAHGVGSEKLLPYVVLSGPRIPGKHGKYITSLDSSFSAVLRGDNRTVPLRDDLILAYIEEEGAQRIDLRSEEYLEALHRRQQLDSFADLLNVPETVTMEEQIQIVANILSRDLAQSIMLEADKPLMTHWDSHEDNDNNQQRCFEHLFQRLNLLFSTLESNSDQNGTPLIDTTTVLVTSEMGRTPKYNSSMGKDHWPYTSMMLFGAGVAGGRVLGKTDDVMMGLPISMSSGESTSSGESLTVANYIAGVLQSFGIDSTEEFPDIQPFSAPFL